MKKNKIKKHCWEGDKLGIVGEREIKCVFLNWHRTKKLLIFVSNKFSLFAEKSKDMYYIANTQFGILVTN